MTHSQNFAEPHLAAALSSGLALAGEMLALAARQSRVEQGAKDPGAPLSAQEESLLAVQADELVAAWLGPLTGAPVNAP